MTLASLIASRKLWRRREIYRYRKWQSARRHNDTAGRTKWFDLYEQARDARRNRDRQIAQARKHPTAVSDAGVALVAEFEGFVPHAYQDAVGVWTIGYGETRKDIVAKGWISEPEARRLLRTRLNRDYLPAVLAAGRGKLNQNAVDGFTSFVYNVGVAGVAANTGVGAALRAGRVSAAADAILAWCRAGGRVLPGLLRRRQAERRLILR